MRKKSRVIILLLVIIFAIIFFNFGGSNISYNNDNLGILTLIPPIVAIILSFVTKNVVISLFLGALSGCFILQITNQNFFYAIIHSFLDFVHICLNSLADPWNAGILLQVLVIGGVINLVSKMGGARAVAEALAKKAKTPRSTQIVTWLLGICVFFDDYANSLIVGPIMKPVADKMKVSRERLAFIIDATAAPIAGIAVISTWVGLEVGLINDAFTSIGENVDAFGIFLQTIPYRFYNILILIFVLITVLLLKEFGPMRKAEIMARKGENKLSDINLGKKELEDAEVKPGVKLSIWNAIIPIGTLIISALLSFYYSGYSAIMAGEDIIVKEMIINSPFSFSSIQQTFSNADASVALFQSALFASIVTIALAVGKKYLLLQKLLMFGLME